MNTVKPLAIDLIRCGGGTQMNAQQRIKSVLALAKRSKKPLVTAATLAAGKGIESALSAKKPINAK